MNTSLNDTQRQHQEIALLLPWLVNNSLKGDEQSRVENHVRHCLVCRRELVNLRRLANMIGQKSDLDVAAETSFARLGDKLGNPAISHCHRKATATRRVWSVNRFTRNSGFRYALAASLVLATMLPLGLQTLDSYNSDRFATLSAARPITYQIGELRVVFAKTASAADIATLLEQLHAHQIGDANSVGAINIRLDSDGGSPDLEQAIAMLRSRPEVLLAEPVLQP